MYDCNRERVCAGAEPNSAGRSWSDGEAARDVCERCDRGRGREVGIGAGPEVEFDRSRYETDAVEVDRWPEPRMRRSFAGDNGVMRTRPDPLELLPEARSCSLSRSRSHMLDKLSELASPKEVY